MTKRLLFDEIKSTVRKISADLGYPEVDFEVSEASKPEFGDASCNIGFLIAKSQKKRPSEIAQSIADRFVISKGSMILEVNVHPSGYLIFVGNHANLIKSVI